MAMSRRDVLVVGGVLATAGLGAAGAPSGEAAGGMFTGRVDDLDFLANQGWCQVILRDGDQQLVAVTKEPRMQSLLELAYVTGKYAEVAYKKGEPNELTRVKVNREARSKK